MNNAHIVRIGVSDYIFEDFIEQSAAHIFRTAETEKIASDKAGRKNRILHRCIADFFIDLHPGTAVHQQAAVDGVV